MFLNVIIESEERLIKITYNYLSETNSDQSCQEILQSLFKQDEEAIDELINEVLEKVKISTSEN